MMDAMCSRYEIDVNARQLASRFDLFDTAPNLPGPELRPTDAALVVHGGRRARLLGWGLRVSWNNRPLINARAETLAQKPTFRPLLGNRCLVPATAYFEWRRQGKARLKNRIAPTCGLSAGGGIFAFAGLVDGDHFTIVTCAPHGAIAHVHDRMPVILSRDGEAAWLDPQIPFAQVAALLIPFAGLIAEEKTEEKAPGKAGAGS